MKKQMIRSLAFTAALVFASSVLGQTAAKPPTIKGTLEIVFNTETDVDANGKPNPGVTNLYKLNLNVSDSALFTGEIVHTPTLFSSVLGRETQPAKLDYKLTASVVNPNNPAQTKAVGRLTGTVPIDRNGVYYFKNGTLRMGIDAAGRAAGFESKFTGIAVGRPPKSDSSASQLTKKVMKITREIKGKKVSVAVSDYDKMAFKEGMTLAAGPVQAYPAAQVSGEMVYDNERFAWYFQNVTVSYGEDGKTNLTDRLTGNIRWVKSPQYDTTGEGEYQFDVRVNEPEQKSVEADAFAPAADESAFFESDPNLMSLTGTMKYKDSLSGKSVTKSSVTVDLVGNKLTKQQVMNLCKLILITSVVPFNSE